MWLLVPFALVSALASVFLMAVAHALPDPQIAVICALIIALSVLIGSAL
jgi:hypothetical protein